jgi:hypothetical protein
MMMVGMMNDGRTIDRYSQRVSVDSLTCDDHTVDLLIDGIVVW